MSVYKNLLFPLVNKVDPETAHQTAVEGLRHGLFPKPCVKSYENLKSTVFGLEFDNPIGLAAGFDKDGQVVGEILKFGFGFVEVGTVTPKPQPGNPKPRMFRLSEDEAVINRLGFNSSGVDAFMRNIQGSGVRGQGSVKNIANRELRTANSIIGINIGKNKDSTEDDYLNLLPIVYGMASYITVNISSPNTPGLRDIQKKEILADFLSRINEKKKELGAKPVLLKVAPDLSDAEIADIAEISVAHGMNGIIVGNTTVSRPAMLRNKHKNEAGGLSGRPLFEISNQTLRKMHKAVGGRIPLIGVGGVFTGKDAYEKIKSGASLVQLYTAVVYEGFWVAEKIKRELSELLSRDGFASVSEAVGTAAS